MSYAGTRPRQTLGIERRGESGIRIHGCLWSIPKRHALSAVIYSKHLSCHLRAFHLSHFTLHFTLQDLSYSHLNHNTSHNHNFPFINKLPLAKMQFKIVALLGLAASATAQTTVNPISSAASLASSVGASVSSAAVASAATSQASSLSSAVASAASSIASSIVSASFSGNSTAA